MGLKVTDIQDKNSQTREIQDKDLANQTSVSQVNTSDYIMLQDTSGGYHKIARTSFVDAIRDAIGPEIANVAKGTDIAKIPVLDSSNGLGMGTLANVASVLGAISNVGKAQITSGDLNDYLSTNGFYQVQGQASAFTNFPSDFTGWFGGTLVCFSSGQAKNQLLISYDGEYFYRGVWGASYGSWKYISYNVPTFYKNYSDLSSLATAMGVKRLYEVVNADNYIEIPSSGVGGIIAVSSSYVGQSAVITVVRDIAITKRALTDIPSLSIERPSSNSNIRIYSSSYTALTVLFISF